MVANCVSAASTASAWTSPVNWEMKILESRLSLNVTVLASEPDDHVADGEPMKHGMVAPASLTLLPGRAQIERFLGVSLGEDDFISVPHGNERGGNILDGLGHTAFPLFQPTTAKCSDTTSSIALTCTAVKARRRRGFARQPTKCL